jgi:GntR family transcriptional regulator/MocR family aminotransferase
MRIIYGTRRTLLVESLQKHFGRKVTVYGDNAGMHFLADFEIDFSEQEAFERALAAGIRVERLYWPSSSEILRPGHVQFVFTFAAVSESDLAIAAERLARAFLT